MILKTFIHDTAEVSDKDNWVKKQLQTCPYLFIDSIEGYTVDMSSGVSILMERARVDYNEIILSNTQQIVQAIKEQDGKDKSIQRKINLANIFGLELYYLLYSVIPHHVWLYKFNNSGNGNLEIEFDSYSSFGVWLENKRTIHVTKTFGHGNVRNFKTSQFKDLPGFDQTLRNNNTPWLGNLDAFISTRNGQPIALIEFQNTSKDPRYHCNNIYFLNGADINRVKSWEIARVHSRLPFFIIVWSKNNDGFKIKSLDCCSFLQDNSTLFAELKGCARGDNNATEKVSQEGTSYSFSNGPQGFSSINHNPPLSKKDKTFPSLYYKYKNYYSTKEIFIDNFLAKVGICPKCGNKLVPRSGPFGSFIGCSSYPTCHFTYKGDI